MRNLLILGVDPGNIVGYAFLNLKGELVLLGSRRHMKISELVLIASKLGYVVKVACDVSKPPEFVKKLARSLGVSITHPEADMTIKEKTKIVDNWLKKQEEFIKIHNKHEKDALASAIKALKLLKPLIRKIEEACLTRKSALLVLQKQIPIAKAK